MKQRTIQKEVSIRGKALHTGKDVTLTLKPAPADTGIVFRRVDLYGKPEVRPLVDLVLGSEMQRQTTVEQNHIKLHTIEHVNSALAGMGVDNCYVEMNESEPPILDGSARPYVLLVQEAGIVEQDKERKYFELKEPVSVTDGNRSVIALPHDGLRITCTSADDRGVHTQHLTIDISPEIYEAFIAPARTFNTRSKTNQHSSKHLEQSIHLEVSHSLNCSIRLICYSELHSYPYR